jgi:NAD kinase
MELTFKEKQSLAKNVIEDYLGGQFTLKQTEKRLTQNKIKMLSFNRGKGAITAYVEINHQKIKLNF